MSHLKPWLWLFAYSFFFVLMMEITLQYVPPKPDVAFLKIKFEETSHWYYHAAFFVHALSSIVTLLAGFTQFSSYFLGRWPLWHRRLGRVYVFTLLGLAGPSGFLIALHANGGIWSQLAFCTLAVLWLTFTLLAIQKARSSDIEAHRAWMLRSFALTMSAITLRAWKYLLVALFHPPPMDVYRVVAWLGWVLNLVLVEVYLYSQKR